jgi:cytochrome c5
MKNMRWAVLVFVLVVAVGCGSGASTPTLAPTTGAVAPTATSGGAPSTVPGATLVNERCTLCHSLDRIQTAHKTEAEWTTTVSRMVQNGARLTAAEKSAVIQYLSATYK